MTAARSSVKEEVVRRTQLSFITVLNPNDASLPTHRRAVRSQAAYFQHQRDPKVGKCKKGRRVKGVVKEVVLIHKDSVTRTLNQATPVNVGRDRLSPDGMEQMTTHFATLMSPNYHVLGQGRVDPFRTYPVPWEPCIPDLVDHCASSLFLTCTHSLTDAARSRTHGCRFARA
jgi:hypothetical protein